MAKQVRQEDNSRIIESTIETIMHNSMMPYSEYVILDRALPRVEDGLKPVQRRILYTMLELGVTPDKPHRKSARIVGDCLGKYHPHGDSSVYQAMVRLAQSYNTRMLLVDGHGNFGSVDGDSAAAMRYTEARLTPLALELLRDLDKDTVPMSLNFDDSLEEPDVLPGRFPNLLVNGATGIAVGLATNIPPHNLGEVIDGVVAFIDNSRITLQEMMQYIPAPDFPTGGLIVQSPEIEKCYATGKGKIVMRAKACVEKDGDKEVIAITEIPYQVNKAELLQKINELRETKKELFGCISDIIDESDRKGMRCVIKLRKDSDSEKVLSALYKLTDLECAFNVNIVAIANGKPEQMGLLDIIRFYVEYQRTVIYKRSQYELAAAKRREHILQGLVIAVHNVREVVEIVLNSKTYNESKDALRARFDLSEKQAIAVLDIPLKRLNKLDIGKMEEELRDLRLRIEELEAIMASKRKQLAIVRKEILEIKKKYADPRRCKLVSEKEAAVKTVDLNARIERNGYLVLTHAGNLKFMSQRSYQMASKGIENCQEADLARRVIACDNNANIIGFTSKGNAVVFNIDALEDDKWKSKGVNIAKIAKVDSDDVLIDIMPAGALEGKELYFYTRRGMVKRSLAEEYRTDKKAVYPAIVLKEDDTLLGVEIVDPECEFILFVSKDGMALNARADIPQQGRKASGVKGIMLTGDDEVIFAAQNFGAGEIVVVNDSGYARRVLLPSIEPCRRFCKGVKLNDNDKQGNMSYVDIVTEPYDFALVLPSGESIAIRTEDLPIENKTSKGKNLLKASANAMGALVVGKCLPHRLI